MSPRSPRSPRSRDPYDPYELGARHSDPETAALEPLPPLLDRVQPMKWLAWFAVAVVVVAVFRTSVGGGPELTGSCDDPGFALSSDGVDQYGALRWAAYGPRGASLVLGLDTDALPTTGSQGRVTGPVALEDCKGSGVLGFRAAPGEHTVVAYLVAQDGTSTELARAKVTVNAP